MLCYPEDWTYITVDSETGFASVIDSGSGLTIVELDSLEEALEFISQPYE